MKKALNNVMFRRLAIVHYVAMAGLFTVYLVYSVVDRQWFNAAIGCFFLFGVKLLRRFADLSFQEGWTGAAAVAGDVARDAVPTDGKVSMMVYARTINSRPSRQVYGKWRDRRVAAVLALPDDAPIADIMEIWGRTEGSWNK